jgi:hypothetical protein
MLAYADDWTRCQGFKLVCVPIVTHCCSAKSCELASVPSEMDFLPTVKEACEKLVAPVRQEQGYQERVEQQLADRELDKSTRLTYKELCDKYGGDGRGGWGLETREKERTYD